jgi:hypothetical protein
VNYKRDSSDRVPPVLSLVTNLQDVSIGGTLNNNLFLPLVFSSCSSSSSLPFLYYPGKLKLHLIQTTVNNRLLPIFIVWMVVTRRSRRQGERKRNNVGVI